MTTEQAIEILPQAFEKVYRNNLSWFLTKVHWQGTKETQEMLDQITNIELIIDPVDPEEPVRIHTFDNSGEKLKAITYEYVGPGHLVLIFYVKDYDDSIEDFYLELYESHTIQDWIHHVFLKYFGLDLYMDFADIVLSVKDSETDEFITQFVIDGNETNVSYIKDGIGKSWKVIEQYF